MEPQAVMVYVFLVVTLLSLTPTDAEVTSEPVGGNATQANTTKEGQDSQCIDMTTPKQRRLDLLDMWLTNEVDSRLNERESRLNTLDTRLTERDARLNDLSRQQIELNARLNRMDGRLDGIETAINDMKEYLQAQMEAMGRKVEWALTGINSKQQNDQVRPRPNSEEPKPVRVYKGCQEALVNGSTTSGVYNISLGHDKVIQVYCEQSLAGGGWTVFQARKDGSVDFYRTWNEYKLGFGELSNEFWLGNDNIHELSKHKDQELKIELTSPEGEVKYADYSSFWIDDEAHNYTLHVSGYSGGSPPGDSLRQHHNSGFSTKDRVDRSNCATQYTGAWWFEKLCHYSNLNGLYGSTENGKGMNWWTWRRHSVSMKATRMLMRKKS